MEDYYTPLFTTTNYNIYISNYDGTSVYNLGAPAQATINDLTATSDGTIYALAGTNVYRYVSGTTWVMEPSSGLSRAIAGGVGAQVWSIAGGSKVNDFKNIKARTHNGNWIDDEVVRTSGNGNSVLIEVPAGSYTISQTEQSGWSLGAIDLYDPTNNSQKNVTTRTSEVNVASAEVVHATYHNFLVTTFPVVNDCQGTPYLETFGTGTTSTFGASLTGQTNYHYQNVAGTTTSFEDGYYMVASNTSQAFSSTNYSDHTSGNNQGRMLIVNASFDKGEFFRRRFTNLLPGTSYTLSAWVMNVTNATIKPNVSFQAKNTTTGEVFSSNTTGDITTQGQWKQYSLTFVAPATEMDLLLVNNNTGGSGNDLAIDDISFRIADISNIVPTATLTHATCNSLTGSITLTAPLGTSIEYSLDGGTYQTSPIFTDVSQGIHSIKARYINSTGCDTPTANFTINAATQPAMPTITGVDDPCSIPNNSTFLYTSDTPGGTWSITSPELATINPTTGLLTPVHNAVGTAMISYTISEGVHCSITATKVITIATSSCTMPVTLIDFTATIQDDQSAVLSWSTSQEINSKLFEIEHSTDGQDWQQIGSVNAQGDHSQVKNYTFTHFSPTFGLNLYRLRMVDQDASFDYSRLISIELVSSIKLFALPNPTTQYIKLQTSYQLKKSLQQIHIFNTLGEQVYQQEWFTDKIDVKHLPNGVYIIRVTDSNGLVYNTKFIIQK